MKKLQALAVGAALALSLAAPGAHAGDYPQRPIKMIVGFSAGSISDITARMVVAEVEKENTLGEKIIVENVPGAGATLAANRVAKSPADGYTLLFAAMGHAVAPALYSKLPYDTVKDFDGVATVAKAHVILVTKPSEKFNSVPDLIAAAKAEPGHYSFGSSGDGTFLHLLGESFAQDTGIKLLHVPYHSGSEAVTAVLGGTIDLAFCTVNTCMSQIRAGKLKPLGYISDKRDPAAPNIPTFKEEGIDFDVSSYNYILAPAGTPAPVLEKLHKAFDTAVQSPTVEQQFRNMGLEPFPSQSPDEVTAFVKSEVVHWAPIVKKIGLKIN